MRTPQRLTVAVILPLTTFFIFGCGAGGPSKLIGDWDTTVPGVGGAVVSYSADGSMKLSGDYSPGGKTSKMIISGTWKEEGDKVHMTYQDVKLTNLSPETQAAEKPMEDAAKKAIGIGTDNVSLIKFEGDDSFTFTDGSGSVSTYKRKGK